MKKSTVIIVDDHTLFREGIKALIVNMGDMFEVIGEAPNGEVALEIIQEKDPEIVLMDIRMPELNGIEATKKVVELYPKTKVIALSMFGDAQYYRQMVDAGIKGFVLKESSGDELQKALESVSKGDSYFSQKLLRNIIDNFTHGESQIVTTAEGRSKLSKREIEVLSHISQGLSNYEIAKELFISQRTVERHRANLLTKTNSKNSISLIMYAIRNNLIDV